MTRYYPSGNNGDTATAANTGGTSWFTTGGTGTISTDSPKLGTSPSVRMAASSTSGVLHTQRTLSSDVHAGDMYLVLEVTPSGEVTQRWVGAGSTRGFALNITSARKIVLRDSANAAAWTSTAILAVSSTTVVRIAHRVDRTAGTASVRIYTGTDPESLTQVDSVDIASGFSAGASSFDTDRIGAKAASGTQTITTRLLGFDVSPGAASIPSAWTSSVSGELAATTMAAVSELETDITLASTVTVSGGGPATASALVLTGATFTGTNTRPTPTPANFPAVAMAATAAALPGSFSGEVSVSGGVPAAATGALLAPTFASTQAPANTLTGGYAYHLVDPSDSSTYTFTGMTLGTPRFDRGAIVGFTWRSSSAGAPLVGVTINGNPASVAVVGTQIDGLGRTYAAIAFANVPSGTTATVVVTLSGAAARAGIGLWTTTGGALSVYGSGSGGTSASLTAPSGGFTVAVAGGVGSTALPISGVTQQFSSFIESTGGNFRITGGSTSTAGPITATVTADSVPAIAAVSFAGLTVLSTNADLSGPVLTATAQAGSSVVIAGSRQGTLVAPLLQGSAQAPAPQLFGVQSQDWNTAGVAAAATGQVVVPALAATREGVLAAAEADASGTVLAATFWATSAQDGTLGAVVMIATGQIPGANLNGQVTAAGGFVAAAATATGQVVPGWLAATRNVGLVAPRAIGSAAGVGAIPAGQRTAVLRAVAILAIADSLSEAQFAGGISGSMLAGVLASAAEMLEVALTSVSPNWVTPARRRIPLPANDDRRIGIGRRLQR